MGKGGGGGGGSQANLQVPTGLIQSLSSETGLGQYASSLLDSLGNLTNFASTLAGSGTGPQIPSFSSQATIAGPLVQFGNSGGQGGWASSFDPQTGMITFTNEKDPAQTFTRTIGFFIDGGDQTWNFGDLSPQILQQWANLYQQNQAGGSSAGGGSQQTAQQALASNPFLSTAWEQIQSIRPLEQQTAQYTAEQIAEARQLYDEGQALYTDATTGMGLFPSQQSWVNQAVASQQSAIDTQLAAEGLSNSTAKAMLEGEAQEAGAATAGQLIQGNIAAAQQQISLAQTSSKLALAGQELSLGEAAAMASAAAGLQSQVWTEAMQGYGMLGDIIKTAASTYGIDVQGYSNILNADVQTQGINAQLAQAREQQANASQGALGSGLGALFSGIGSLFGGGAAAGGGGAAIGALGGILTSVIGFF